jgi:putative ABC transport system permease protein
MSRWIRSQVATLDPALPVDIATLEQRVSKLADGRRFQALLVGLFAAIGLLLAVIGFIRVISFLVTQRSQEIGVRVALGANRRDIRRLVMAKSLRLIIWEAGIGLVAALAISRVLSNLLYSIEPHDPASFVLVTLLLVFVGVIATLIPARSAAKLDPIEALRCE